MEKLVTLFKEIFAVENPDTADGHLKAVFSGKRRKSLEYNKVTMRPVILGDRLVYQAEYSFPKKVTHTNLEAADAVSTALRLVEEDFKQVNIFTASEEIQVGFKTTKPADYIKKICCRAYVYACPFSQQNQKLYYPRRRSMRLSHRAGCNGPGRKGLSTCLQQIPPDKQVS